MLALAMTNASTLQAIITMPTAGDQVNVEGAAAASRCVNMWTVEATIYFPTSSDVLDIETVPLKSFLPPAAGLHVKNPEQ